MGVTMARIVVDPQMLEACVRDVLNLSAPRCMAVLNPIRVKLVNLPSDTPKQVSVPNFPAEPSKGSHIVPFEELIYIDADDFKEVRFNAVIPITFSHIVHFVDGRTGFQKMDAETTSWVETCRPRTHCQADSSS